MGAHRPGGGDRPRHVLQAPEEVGLLEDEDAGRLGPVRPVRLVRQGQAVVPSTRSITRSSWPEPAANVAMTSRQWGWTPRETQTPWRPVAATDRFTASTHADAPSYSEALATSIPVSRHTRVWYSNRAWRTPWATSGWYGVYDVTNSERKARALTTDGMSWS